MKKIVPLLSTAGMFALTASQAFAQFTIKKDPTFRVGDLGVLIGAALAFALIIAAILAFIFLILGGLQWITSGGDKAQLEAARGKITNAIVGLIVVAASWGIMLLVQQFLGLSLFGQNQTLPSAVGN